MNRAGFKECACCGKSFLPPYKSAKYCSVECRGLAQRTYKGTTRECVICGKEFDVTRRGKKCCSDKCARISQYSTMQASTVFRECDRCGEEYEVMSHLRTYSKYCTACRIELYGSNGACTRAKKWGVEYETVRKEEVFARDNWTCQICGEKVDRKKNWPHPDSASLDHIVPISCGGGHTWSNVQCTHWRCNASKYNKVDNSQLRLELTA